MNNWRHWIKWRPIPGSVIFTIFVGLVVVNLIALLSYTNYSKHEERLASSEEIIIHIANTLYLLQISAPTEWERIAKVSQTPELSVELSDKPHWPLQMREQSLGRINDVIEQIPNKLAVSILLDNSKWLNVNFTPRSNAALLQIFILSLGTVVALALLFSAWSMLRFTTPLKQFKKAAEQLGVTLGSEPMIGYGPAIVRETAQAMNQMQARIRHLLQDRNRMLAAISHDLRTPITRLKLRAQFIEDRKFYQEIVSDLDEMEEMIEQILTYTKEGYSQEKVVDFDIIALIYSLCDEKSEQGFNVECVSKLNRLTFKGRQLAIKRAFINLLANAVKYANAVKVYISLIENNMIVVIEDDGPGIPEDQLQKVFIAFYRGDPSRSAKTGGTGLGLAIAQDVIHDHQGSIHLKNRETGGLQVKVILKLKAG